MESNGEKINKWQKKELFENLENINEIKIVEKCCSTNVELGRDREKWF